MAGSISDFKSSFNTELARPHRFDVDIPIPITLIPYNKTARNLRYRCESAQLPGRTFATADQKTYGPIEKHPYLSTYEDLELTFIVDGDMNQKVFFDAWMNYINPTYTNDFKYKNNYSTAITINQYDMSNKLTYSISAYGAYPISMNQLDLTWNDDSYHKLSVTFAYTYWQNNSLQALGMQFLEAGLENIFDGTNLPDGARSTSINAINPDGKTEIYDY
jgi:hypothetical protein